MSILATSDRFRPLGAPVAARSSVSAPCSAGPEGSPRCGRARQPREGQRTGPGGDCPGEGGAEGGRGGEKEAWKMLRTGSRDGGEGGGSKRAGTKGNERARGRPLRERDREGARSEMGSNERGRGAREILGRGGGGGARRAARGPREREEGRRAGRNNVKRPPFFAARRAGPRAMGAGASVKRARPFHDPVRLPRQARGPCRALQRLRGHRSSCPQR